MMSLPTQFCKFLWANPKNKEPISLKIWYGDYVYLNKYLDVLFSLKCCILFSVQFWTFLHYTKTYTKTNFDGSSTSISQSVASCFTGSQTMFKDFNKCTFNITFNQI